MHPRLTESNPPTTLQAIQTVEQELRVRFPDSYRQFLVRSNGGRPDTPIFPINGMHLNPNGNVNFLFGADANYDVYDLLKSNQFYASRIPVDIVLIADNGMGDYLCLDLRDKKVTVVFWDNKHFWGTGEWRERDLYHVASSFEEFLGSLKPYP